MKKSIYERILDQVAEAFDCPETMQEYEIFIQFLVGRGMILYDDRIIDTRVLVELIENGKVTYDCVCSHQGEKSIRYKFIGYQYPDKHFRRIKKNLREEVLKEYDYKCADCGSYRRLEIDHISPFSKGGKTQKHNLQVLCRYCNSRKGNR